MTDNRNTILAVILSGLVLIAWQYFYNVPQMEKQRAEAQRQAELQKPAPQATPGTTPQAGSVAGASGHRDHPAGVHRIRDQPRSRPRSQPAHQDRKPAHLRQHLAEGRPHRRPGAGEVSRDGRPEITRDRAVLAVADRSPYYAEFGWVPATGSTSRIPDQNTMWQQEGSGALTPTSPVTLKYDNGDGLTFRRTIAIDDRYLFTIKDEVTNVGTAPVTLYPFALISRHGTPEVSGYYILHEGLIGYLGDQGLQEYAYKKIDDAKSVNFNVTNGWLGITDKYWASALLPDTNAKLQARFSSNQVGTKHNYQTDYLQEPQTLPIGGTISANARLFAGAKEASVVGINFPLVGFGGYNKELGLNHFDLLIDWGWFYFITKPMFLALDWFYRFFGNFGVSILLVTVLVKLLFFPLANKSYASMAKMKSVQPQLAALKERYPDDQVKQQQEMMEIYKKEKINPIAGCLPVVVQIPVFFSLYKVLFVTIEMRHAPFFGWIKDLSAPDPTNLFNLFGLIPFDPTQLPLFGHYLALGIWPIIMGITMWFQMKLNPTPPDPTQKMIFDWMPLDLHLHAGGLPGRARDLLGLEQYALGAAAKLHHAPERREGRTVRQSQGNLHA